METGERNLKMGIRNLSIYYRASQILHNCYLEIAARTITALIGPSGSGKTTFLRTLNRMNDLINGVRVEGEVMLDDKNIYASGVDVVALRKRVGMIFQKANPFPMTVYDNVAYGPRVHGVRARQELDAIVEASLKRAALWDEVQNRLHKNAFGLSGGQQQRLCIARLLAVEPEVVLLDEPSSALDPISTMKIEELIRLLKQDYTIVIVTHNMQQAARMSDYTALFLNGEIIEYADTETMFTRPRDGRTEDYITGRFG